MQSLGTVPQSAGNSADKRGYAEAWLEWLLARDSLARAAQVPRLSDPSREWLRLARAAAKLADHVATSRDPALDLGRAVTATSVRPLALALYREAMLWALSAYAGRSVADEENPSEFAPREALVAAAGGEERLRRLTALMSTRPAPRAAELEPPTLEQAGAFVHGMLSDLEQREDPVGRVSVQRRKRWLFLGLALVPLAFAVHWWTTRNYAAEAHWRSSSALDGPSEGVGFALLSGKPRAFFHTREQRNPWIEFDLGVERSISSLRIQNRADCCLERAVPLVVEAGLDRDHLVKVGECTESFVECALTLPTTRARYVKLHVPRRTYLHLEYVELR